MIKTQLSRQVISYRNFKKQQYNNDPKKCVPFLKQQCATIKTVNYSGILDGAWAFCLTLKSDDFILRCKLSII